MKQEITLRQLQEAISKIDHKNNSIDKYFYKLSEEVGELAKVIRKNKRLATSESIKDTIEEELYDVLYYMPLEFFFFYSFLKWPFPYFLLTHQHT